MSDIDRAELRRLLAEATPGPWGLTYGRHERTRLWSAASGYTDDVIALDPTTERGELASDMRIIMAAVNALPGLLDALDALDVAEAAIERVREMHYAADNDPARTPRCEECEGRAGTHPCGCWAPEDRQPVCGHCNDPERGQTVPWPCPTVQALDGGGSDE